jgi:hypothetical protein
VDLIQGDIANPAVFDGIFERYSTQGGIYAVIHVAVSTSHSSESGIWLIHRYIGSESCRRVRGDSPTVLPDQRISNHQPHAGAQCSSPSRSAKLTLYRNSQSMLKYQCLNLVYSSSATVYGTPETIPIPETSPVQPESVYGRSKGMCEDIIKDLCHAERSFNAVSLRYFK